MRILIIAPSLKNYADGVASYSELLAGQMQRAGHQLACLSLYDKDEDCTAQAPVIDDIVCLRLPKFHASERKRKEALDFVRHFDPHWVSVQLSPYAYQAKGLPYQLFRLIVELCLGRKVQLMVHELWVGKTSLRNQVYAMLQKRLIARFLHQLKPNLLHTQLPEYIQELKELGWKALPLPLFSNIATFDIPKKGFSQCHGEPSSSLDGVPFSILIWGGIKWNKEISHFLTSFAAELKKRQQKLSIYYLGKNSVPRPTALANLTEQQEPYLDERALSDLLSRSDLLLTDIPRHALGKSGKVAAALHHGLPIAAPHVLKHYSVDDLGFFDSNLTACVLKDASWENYCPARQRAQNIQGKLGVAPIVQQLLEQMEDLA